MEDLLRRGESILLFPEGTRSKDGTLGRGKVGVGKITRDARPVVVPAYVEGFDRVLGHGRIMPRFRVRNYLLFGHPLDLADLYDLEPCKQTSQLIVDAAYAYFNEDGMQARFLASNNMAVWRDVFLAIGGFGLVALLLRRR